MTRPLIAKDCQAYLAAIERILIDQLDIIRN